MWLGVAHLASVLAQKKHDCKVLIEPRVPILVRKLCAMAPDIVAFSLTTGLEQWVKQAIISIKSTMKTRVIVGGPHPTFFPEYIEQAPIDALCRGEAEEAFALYADCLSGKAEDAARIPNLWVRLDGKIVQNDVAPLVPDLDRYPIPNIGLYFDDYPHMRRFYRYLYPIVSGRGCPMSCTYCFNKSFRELYRGKGRIVRRRKFDHLAEELIHAKKKYRITQVYFQDDTFLDPSSWFEVFSQRYPFEVGLPYFCLVRAESVDDPLADTLADSGCVSVTIGVETGSESVRQEVLGKGVRNETIIRAVRLLHKRGITVQTDMILGLPGQDLEGALESLRFVNRIQSDFAWCSLLQPYPGTEIHQTVMKFVQKADSGWAFTGKGIPASYFEDTVLTFPNKREIVNLQKLFQPLHRWRIPEPWIRRIIHAPLGCLFNLIHAVSFNLTIRRIKRIPWPVFLREALRILVQRTIKRKPHR